MANCNNIWRPYLAEISEEEDVQEHLQPGTSNEVNLKTKQHPRIGDVEKRLVLRCHNTAVGNGWSAVISSARQEATECAGLPPHVVNLYLSESESHLKGRMQRILKDTSRQDVPESSGLMRYATLRTPAKRKRDNTTKQAVVNKLNKEFNISSDSSSEEERGKEKIEKRKTADVAEEANEAHTRMCERAMNTMGTINTLLAKLEKKN